MLAPVVSPPLARLGVTLMGHSIFPRDAFDTWPYFEFPLFLIVGELFLFCNRVLLKCIGVKYDEQLKPKQRELKYTIYIMYLWMVLSLVPIICGITWYIQKSELHRQSLWMLVGSIGMIMFGIMYLNVYKMFRAENDKR